MPAAKHTRTRGDAAAEAPRRLVAVVGVIAFVALVGGCSSDDSASIATTTTTTTLRPPSDATFCAKTTAADVQLALFVKMNLATTTAAQLRAAVTAIGLGVTALDSLTTDITAPDHEAMRSAYAALDRRATALATDESVAAGASEIQSEFVALKLAFDRATAALSCPRSVTPR